MAQAAKTVVLGITGGIAAYKACEVVSRLKKAGVNVHVIMSRNACEFVQPLTLQTLSQNLVAVDTFEAPDVMDVEHISLAKKADVLLIAPATANIIAKLALGIADDMLTTTALATQAPLLIAPAMNTVMWQHPATQANLATLVARGAKTIGPDGGLLACGDVGAGRMSEPADIVEACLNLLMDKQDLQGQRVLVTAGPTREALDPVRYLTNRSSGKMGYAIALAAQARGAQVTLVTGPVSLQAPLGVSLEAITTTQDLYEAMTRLAPQQDIIIQAAAPADYTPVTVQDQKIKKLGDEPLRLEFRQTQDVAAAIGERKKPGQFFVGFAAETENLTESARKKLHKKKLDLIALNDVSRRDAGFDVDTNALTLISPNHEVELPLLSKQEAAHRLLDEVVRLRRERLDA
ncbi:MAG: bifunctional phosphopantothenoylcysteine decarboxylase/phosphopantothenate--cysteine ligase CoaBC [Christensenellales bacterium]|jgi:phosphopantothenoylcysteine decarboxylase/phosphopantothenate--cysteine ligase|nr:bifunctional phosphopantothenoylcysteine decarboxylase/phosphopantothenate--cysteine ligase CoaBC [Clostridiales bacterium]